MIGTPRPGACRPELLPSPTQIRHIARVAGRIVAARFHAENRFVLMAKDLTSTLFGNPPPEAAQTLLALLHAQGEVARLSEREQLYSSLLDSVNAVLWAFDWETRRVLYVSPAYERIFGRPASLVLADYNAWRDSIYPDDTEYAERSLAQVLDTGSVEDREYRIINAAGQVRWLSDKCYVNQQRDSDQRVIIVGIAEDITEKKQLEGELQRLATTDVLTQSSNRRHFFECARQALKPPGRKASPWPSCCWTSMTSNRSTTPMATGKVTVLQRIADSGRAVLRRGDLFGRIGGEEFAAVFPGCTAQIAEQIAGRLQREIQHLSFSHGQQVYGVTVSQGVTELTDADDLIDTLFARADAAMYQAKRQGKNQIVRG